MFVDAIVRLFEYQREANSHILDVFSRLDSRELVCLRSSKASFRSEKH